MGDRLPTVIIFAGFVVVISWLHVLLDWSRFRCRFVLGLLSAILLAILSAAPFVAFGWLMKGEQEQELASLLLLDCARISGLVIEVCVLSQQKESY